MFHIFGQCSPEIEELLKSENAFDDLGKKDDTIGLMKLVENYVIATIHTNKLHLVHGRD